MDWAVSKNRLVSASLDAEIPNGFLGYTASVTTMLIGNVMRLSDRITEDSFVVGSLVFLAACTKSPISDVWPTCGYSGCSVVMDCECANEVA